jgi:hypothetical protein
MGTLASSQEMLDLALLFVVIGGVTLVVATILHLIEAPTGHRATPQSVFGYHAQPGPRPAAPTDSQGAATHARKAEADPQSNSVVTGEQHAYTGAANKPDAEAVKVGRARVVVDGRRAGAGEPQEASDSAPGRAVIGRLATPHSTGPAGDRGEKPRLEPIALRSREAIDQTGDEAPHPGDSGDRLATFGGRKDVVEAPPEPIIVQRTALPELPPPNLSTAGAASPAAGPIESAATTFTLSGHYFRISGLRHSTLQDTKQ